MRHVIVMTATTSVGLRRFPSSIFVAALRVLAWRSEAHRGRRLRVAGLFFRSRSTSASQSRSARLYRGRMAREMRRRKAACGIGSCSCHSDRGSGQLRRPAAAAGDSDPLRRPWRDTRCRLDLSRDHASGHRFAWPRHAACEHIARRWRCPSLNACNYRGGRCHRHSRSDFYFWSRLWRHWRRHCRIDFTIRDCGRWFKRRRPQARSRGKAEPRGGEIGSRADDGNRYSRRPDQSGDASGQCLYDANFSHFGEAVVAAFAIVDRLNPMAFGVLFALSSIRPSF